MQAHCLSHSLQCAAHHFLVLFLCCAECHCFSMTSFHLSLMCVLFCSAPSSSSSSCILSGLPVPVSFLFLLGVFSCACAPPSRSEHRGTHSDPSGGKATEDQPPAQAGGGQRYEQIWGTLFREGLCVCCCLFFTMLSTLENKT